ncbi:hypothetical protein D3C77_327950 [compost metagenome]
MPELANAKKSNVLSACSGAADLDLGEYPCSLAICNIRSRVSALMPCFPLSANDTAALETPAILAISSILTVQNLSIPIQLFSRFSLHISKKIIKDKMKLNLNI